jgi:PAS domain S-box-containing protein
MTSPARQDDAWRVALLDSSLDCVIVMDGDGRIVDLNGGTEETFGVQRASIVGRRLAEVFVPPELREAHERGLARYLRTGASRILGQRIEVTALHANGRPIPIELSIVRLHGIEPPLFVGHLRPIEEQLRKERRLLASAAASEALARSATAADATAGVLKAIGEQLAWSVVQFWTVAGSSIELTSAWSAPGANGEATQSFRSFGPGTGLPGTVWQTGRPLWIEDVRFATNLPRIRSLLEAGFRSAVGIPVHVRGHVVGMIEAFGTVPQTEDPQLLVLLEAIVGQLGHFIEEFAAGEALSSTEAKLLAALEREQEARRGAEEANRGKDQMLAIVSHELRTPLGPILGWARMLQNVVVTPDVLTRALAAIERNAALQARLVDDLLDMSRIVTGKLSLDAETVDLVQVVQSALETHRAAAAAKPLWLDFDGDIDVPPIRGDASRLQQVVSNLLANAVKFTPPDGRVVVSLRHDQDWVELSVRDSGAGMDPALLPHIFEPFKQGQANAGAERGLGLGLAIVRELVRAHKGDVRAASPGPGEGSTFTVRLPVRRQAAPEDDAESRQR